RYNNWVGGAGALINGPSVKRKIGEARAEVQSAGLDFNRLLSIAGIDPSEVAYVENGSVMHKIFVGRPPK
ncbi:MAG: hypothetical protein ACREUF_02760, partial [Solimonas sp.]